MNFSWSLLAVAAWLALHPKGAQLNAPAPAPQPSQGFVTRDGHQLMVDSKPYYFAGCNFYPAMVNAAAGGIYREQTRQVLQTMQELGLTVLRTWAFNEASDNTTWMALQTEPEMFDETVYREGLDWLVSEAPKYNVKLMLTLTNYQVGYGGAYQYSVWNDEPNIFGFYTNRTIIDWYLNSVETTVTRMNSITGVAYRDDPTIFAWDLINEPHVPGDDTGDVLTLWLDLASKFVKYLDPNHLVGVGIEGGYGRSTPEMLRDNPLAPYWSALANGGNPAPYAGICEGQDFYRNHDLEGIDFTSVHLYTDFYGVGDLEGQLEFVERSLQGHMNISEALQKPLIITEWGKLPPIPERNAFSKFIYDLAAQSASEGGVLAGNLVWTLGTSPTYPYENGFDGYGVYASEKPYLEKPPGSYVRPTSALLSIGTFLEFFGWAQLIECNARYATNPQGRYRGNPSASEGWEETVALMRGNAAALARISAGNSLPSSKHLPSSPKPSQTDSGRAFG